jgi:ankyrin repeat protein
LADEQGYNAALWRVVSEDFQVNPNYDLWHASAAGELPGIERALNAGSDVNSKTRNGQTPLSLAVLSDQSAAARYLLDHGAAQDWLSPIEGTLLAYAQSRDMVDLLVDHGVDPNRADKNGWCPLVWSVGRSSGTKDFKAVSIELIAKSAKVNCANRNGMIALHFARDPEISKLLIDHGADVNALDNGGFTPLHQAAARGDLEIVKMLIDAGAKNLRGKQNQLPIDLARASVGGDRAVSDARAEVLETLSRLPVPAQGNMPLSTSGQLAAVQQEKSTVDTDNVTTITTRELDENSGKTLLEGRLNKEYVAAIGWLGTFKLGWGDNWEKKLLSGASQSTDKALQAAGLVIYTEEHRAPALPGLVTDVTIKPTSLIQPYVREKDGYGWFEIPPPKYKIHEIVKKDRYETPMGEIAFVAGTLDVDVNPIYLTWAKALNPNHIQGLATQSKFRAVLQKDSVEDSWKASEIDIANQGSEFSSHNAELPPFGLTRLK